MKLMTLRKILIACEFVLLIICTVALFVLKDPGMFWIFTMIFWLVMVFDWGMIVRNRLED